MSNKSEGSHVALKTSDKQQLCKEFALNDETLTSYQESFNLFDKDGDGRITPEEISVLCKSLGYTMSKASIRNMMMLCDIDGNGILDFKEFLQLLTSGRQRCQVKDENELDEIFKVFDANHDGYIDEKELSSVLRRLGETLNEHEIKEMIVVADTEGIGKVSLKDFKKILTSRNSIH